MNHDTAQGTWCLDLRYTSITESVVDITYEATLSDFVNYCMLTYYRVIHFFVKFSTFSILSIRIVATAHFA